MTFLSWFVARVTTSTSRMAGNSLMLPVVRPLRAWVYAPLLLLIPIQSLCPPPRPLDLSTVLRLRGSMVTPRSTGP